MLKGFFYYFVMTIVIVLLTIDIFPNINIHGMSPDIVLIFVIFLAQQKGSMKGQIAGFILGLLMDLMSGSFFGTRTASYLIVGYIIGYFYLHFIVNELMMKFLVVFLATTLFAICLTFFQWIFYKINFFDILTKQWIFILYTVLISPFFLLIFSFFDKKFIES